MSDIRANFDRYAAAFTEYDEERLVSFFYVPCLMVNGRSVVLLPDAGAVRTNVGGLLRHHRAEGVELARVESVRSESLGPDLAIAHIEWHVGRGDRPAWEFANTYNLTRPGDGEDWKIVVSTTHEASA